MASTKNVHNTPTSAQLRELHSALLEIVGVMNRPQRDEATIREAGISLDRALFALLILVERFGPIGVGDLADRVGRDHTTVSRQVAKLEKLGLITRKVAADDRRFHRSIVTPKGKAMTDRIDAARERIAADIAKSWSKRDISELVRLLRKLADALATESSNKTGKS